MAKFQSVMGVSHHLTLDSYRKFYSHASVTVGSKFFFSDFSLATTLHVRNHNGGRGRVFIYNMSQITYLCFIVVFIDTNVGFVIKNIRNVFSMNLNFIIISYSLLM